MWQEDFVKALNDEFKHLKEQKPSYSLRSFATKLGLSPGSLSDTLKKRKKWRIRPKRAAEILAKLSLPFEIKDRLLFEMGEDSQIQKASLKTSDYDVLTDWTYYPILFSFDLPDKLCRVSQIAARLGVEEEKVRAVVADLLRRGLLVKAENGSIRRPQEDILTTSDGPPSQVIRKHHAMNIELAKRALREIPAKDRDFTSLTFAGNSKQIEFLRAEIRKLHDAACVILNEGDQNECVFRLSVQLYPVESEK